jgi:hypothetical protein
MSTDLPLLTNSRLKSFRACQRQHRYRYTLGYRPVATSEALNFGTAIHLALEAFWRGGRSFDAAIEALPSDLDPFARARALAMLSGYATAWETTPLTVLGVERTFALPLINPETGAKSRTWQLAGKLDVLARLADGRVAVIEHKTSAIDAGEGSTYRQRLTMDSQVSAYFDGADSLAATYGYERADLVLYDVLIKPGIKPLKATPEQDRKYTKPTKTEPSRLYANQREVDETPDEYLTRCANSITADINKHYFRVEVVRLESERDEYRFDVWQLAESIRVSERTGKAPKNPDACMRYGTPCEFWGVCSGTESLDDPSRFRRVDDVNEELNHAA